MLSYSQTEQYKFRHLTTEDGLPSNYTWSVMQDSRGFMWFTTRAGLCRYDGYNLKVFQYDPSDSTTISDIYTKSVITEDTNGFIWVGTINGLNKFDPITEKFTRYFRNPDDPHSISSNWMRITYLDRKGIVWIGTDLNGLNRYNTTTDNFDYFLPSPDFSLSSGIRGIYEDSSGILWVGTANGLYQFDRETEEFILIKQIMEKGERIANRFTTITEDNNGNIWYCADRIYKYNKSTKEFTLFTKFSVESIGNLNPTYMNILLDKHDNNQTLWISRDGLYKYDLSAGRLTTIYNDPSGWESFVGRNPRGLYLDPTGLLWIATTSGISVLDPRSSQIKSHPDVAEKFQLDAVSFLKDSQGHFWIGGDNGMVHYDENMRLIHWYKPLKENKNSFNGIVRKILEDSENNIWIACHNDGVYVLDRVTNEFLPCKLIRYGKDFKPDNLIDIYEDAQGTLWVGSDGLFKRLKNSPEPTTFNLDTSNGRTKINMHTRIIEDQSGNLWTSSPSGALLCQSANFRGTEKFIEYTHDPNDPNSLSNSHIWTVYVDDHGEVWVGTNHGLNRYVPEKDCFERYLLDAEGGASFIYGIVRDRNGYLWMTTENGLIGFDPSTVDKTANAKNQIKQCLPFNQAYRGQLYKDPAGIIYVGSAIGTRNGYYSFHPDDITKNRNIPPIVITSFTVRNKTVELDTAITLKQNLTLRYNENYFSFEFAALDYTKPDQNQYAYMLDGVDEDWIYSGNRRFANYTNVKPGIYTFKVKGSNSDGYWNEAGTQISICILPPPWFTWWAYSLYALFVIGLIYAWRRYDLKRQRLKQQFELEHVEAEKLKELDTLKSRFFANISHEFRTPLTLILGPVEKHLPSVKDQSLKQDLNVVQRNARRLQRLINQILNLSKIESGKMKLQASEQNIVSLVNGYVQSFESLAKQKKIDLIFNSDEKDIKLYIDKDKIEKILYNLLSNAFKFTDEGGKIEIEVSSSQSTVRSPQSTVHIKSTEDCRLPTADFPGPWVSLSIFDTGCCIPPEKLDHIFDRFYQADDSNIRDHEGTGIGLALTKELVKLHYGEISVKSQPGMGTTFTVYLPGGKRHLRRDEIVEEILSEKDNEDTSDKYPELEQIEEKEMLKQQSDKSKPILLLVEDNSDLRAYIRGSLDKSYNVLEAVDGEEGLMEGIKHIPDLVLSDVMMPKMDGFELCTRLKSDERTSHIPIIILTARASSESKIEGLETGADDYISKPFDPTELQIRIKNLIQQRQKLREKFANDFWKENKLPTFLFTASGLNQMDKKFLQKALDIVNLHLSDTDFNVVQFGQEIAMSRQQMHRKFRALVNQSATEFIRTIRLKKAAELLSQKSGTVSEIAYDVGFNTLSYFTKSFQEQFGVTPSEYAEKSSGK